MVQFTSVEPIDVAKPGKAARGKITRDVAEANLRKLHGSILSTCCFAS